MTKGHARCRLAGVVPRGRRGPPTASRSRPRRRRRASSISRAATSARSCAQPMRASGSKGPRPRTPGLPWPRSASPTRRGRPRSSSRPPNGPSSYRPRAPSPSAWSSARWTRAERESPTASTAAGAAPAAVPTRARAKHDGQSTWTAGLRRGRATGKATSLTQLLAALHQMAKPIGHGPLSRSEKAFEVHRVIRHPTRTLVRRAPLKPGRFLGVDQN